MTIIPVILSGGSGTRFWPLRGVAIGVENIVVVESDDTILVCNKDNVQDVKKAADLF
ncbi:MAG: hypothetical protein MJ185_02165 [Treponema sp.]|nr:hypothetical protein [Treponema sp.]